MHVLKEFMSLLTSYQTELGIRPTRAAIDVIPHLHKYDRSDHVITTQTSDWQELTIKRRSSMRKKVRASEYNWLHYNAIVIYRTR